MKLSVCYGGHLDPKSTRSTSIFVDLYCEEVNAKGTVCGWPVYQFEMTEERAAMLQALSRLGGRLKVQDAMSVEFIRKRFAK